MRSKWAEYLTALGTSRGGLSIGQSQWHHGMAWQGSLWTTCRQQLGEYYH